jgi:hypothetical protein
MRYAIVNPETKKVVNVIEWDGKAPWECPWKGHHVIQSDIADRNDRWETDGSFTKYHILETQEAAK